LIDHNEFWVVPDSPYNQNITLSNFWLFGDLKLSVESLKFESFAALQEFIEAILREIPADLYRIVFHGWIKRLERIIEHDGMYYNLRMRVSKLEDG
jgi:hypothetical protein